MPTFAVTTGRGPAWDDSRGIREQRAFDEHSDFVDDLVRRGIILLGGPIESSGGTDLALLAVQADSPEHVREIFAADPWSTYEVFRLMSIRTWTIWLRAASI